ncbi:MAG TPA: ACT domain-containing protein [Tepidisphaeraceae bacterium]|nr:ACT domain-containing protein [Tepidisphaeraceae bacterium]
MPARTITQFSVFLVNKPGVLAQVTKALAEAKVNIIAMTLVDSQEHGVMRLVAEDPQQTRQVLARLNLPTTETEVLALELSNRPGALADVAELLAKNHLNINYAYVSSGAPGGRTTGIFKVNDTRKALRLLKDSSAKASRQRGLATRQRPGTR